MPKPAISAMPVFCSNTILPAETSIPTRPKICFGLSRRGTVDEIATAALPLTPDMPKADDRHQLVRFCGFWPGTAFYPDLNNTVLLLEDVDDKSYRF